MTSGPGVRPLRIALVSPYDLAHPGGVGHHVRQLAVGLQRFGHLVRVIAPWSGPDDALPREFPFSPVGFVVAVPTNGSVARIAWSPLLPRRVQQLLHAEPFDVVHVHEPLLPGLSLAVLRQSTTVTVGTFHAYRPSSLAYRYARPMLDGAFRRLHGRIAVSPATITTLSREFDADYAVIPNGIDVARFGTVAPHMKPRAQSPTILFVGRFDESRKGLRYLLDALPSVRTAVPNVRLVVVGRGRPERFRSLLAALPEGTVTFAGCVADANLPGYYAACDVFCAPSTGHESFGIVLLEAMAAGRAVVASDIAGYAGVVRHGHDGLLVARQNPAALAEALITVLRDAELRDRLGQHGRLTAAAHDWAHISQRVLRYYRDVAMPAKRLLAGVR